MSGEPRRHKFLNKHTIIGAILMLIVSASFTQLGMSLFASHLLGGLLTIVLTIILMAFYKFWFRGEYDGFSSRTDFKTVGMLLIPILVYWVGMGIISATQGEYMTVPTLSMIGLALTAGFSEEISFRGVPGSYLMRQWTDERSVMKMILFTSIIFGLTHAGNIIAGADPGSTAIQVVTAFAMGLYLCAIFLRTGNFWICIAIHTIHDIYAFASSPDVVDGIIVGGVDFIDVVDLFSSICLGIAGLYMVRSSKRAEIRALWDKKWAINKQIGSEENL